jgi:hypothetical protein
MSWHGYQPTGSRVVAYPTDEQGLPLVQKSLEWTYNVWSPDGVQTQVARPQGGNLNTAPYLELTPSWSKRPGLRPSGTPVGITVASDGSLWMVEDKNKTIVVMTRSEQGFSEDANSASKASEEVSLKINPSTFVSNEQLKSMYEAIHRDILQTTCAGCHPGLQGSAEKTLQFLASERWILPRDKKSPLILRIRGEDGLQKMPLGGSLSLDWQNYIESWILQTEPK